MVESTATERLIQRMLSYDGCFDGYPTTSCHDEELIQAACKECDQDDSLVLLAYLASEHVTDQLQHRNARSFIADYVDTVWSCNMCEGSNPVHAELEGD